MDSFFADFQLFRHEKFFMALRIMFFCVSFSSLLVLQLHSVGLLPPMYDKVEGVN